MCCQHTCVRVAPGRQMQLSRVWVENIHILVEEQLHKFGRLQKFPLAAQDTGSLLWGVHHPAARQGENHHKGVLCTQMCTKIRAHKRAKSQTHAKAINAHTLTHTPRHEAKINTRAHMQTDVFGFVGLHLNINLKLYFRTPRNLRWCIEIFSTSECAVDVAFFFCMHVYRVF